MPAFRKLIGCCVEGGGHERECLKCNSWCRKRESLLPFVCADTAVPVDESFDALRIEQQAPELTEFPGIVCDAFLVAGAKAVDSLAVGHQILGVLDHEDQLLDGSNPIMRSDIFHQLFEGKVVFDGVSQAPGYGIGVQFCGVRKHEKEQHAHALRLVTGARVGAKVTLKSQAQSIEYSRNGFKLIKVCGQRGLARFSALAMSPEKVSSERFVACRGF